MEYFYQYVRNRNNAAQELVWRGVVTPSNQLMRIRADLSQVYFF